MSRHRRTSRHLWDLPQPDPGDAEAAAAQQTLGTPHMIRATRRAFGPGIATEISADAYHETGDYVYFGFLTADSAQLANESLEQRRHQLRVEGLKKPHCLMIAGLPLGSETRWLTLAVGVFECDRKRMVMRPGAGPSKLMLFFGFDSQQEVVEAAARVRECPEYKQSTTKLALYRLSRHNGKDLDIQPLPGEVK